MKLLVTVNVVAEVHPSQTTAALLASAVARGWEVWVGGAGNLAWTADDRIVCRACKLTPGKDDRRAIASRLRKASLTELDLADLDVVLVRTNPARPNLAPVAHDTALQLLGHHVDRGGLVLSDPEGLRRAQGKLYLMRLPAALRPRSLVTTDARSLERFVRHAPGKVVLKPLHGTRGTDVFFLDPADPQNLRQIAEALARTGPAMAQDFVPEATDGDVRLVMIEGAPLAVDGKVAAVRRRPAEGELRSNVAQGGEAAPAEDVEAALAVARAIGPHLVRDGLFLVGLDVIGDRAVEVNVFSPGGLDDAGAFEGVDFVPPILDAVEARVAAHRGE